ncbi:hypothetical protein GGI20_004701 [Coemansia sp. BCRC 34301]|nr:hypothetical protein GGI20_004701 [Coemansia sp. BCRC 34301]
MRLPFSIHRGFKSSDNFVQLASDSGPPSHPETKELAQRHRDIADASPKRSSFATEQPRRAGSPGAGRDRGMSTASYMGATSPQQQQYSRGRPLSAVFVQPPAADWHLAQIEEELDTIMDEMGLQAEQRLPMKNMSLDSKVQLIHTHKAKCSRGSRRANAAPLSDHLKILTKAGTQSLPRARLEKLRVDIAYQSMQQLNAFIEDGGLRLLITHLAQLNERKSATRRQDELVKEREILCCILGMAKVGVGAKFLLEGTSAHLRHILDSVGTLWLPCSVMSLRIVSYLAQQDGVHSIDVIIASLFRRDAAADDPSSGAGKRSTAFVEWMQTIDHAMDCYEANARAPTLPTDQQQVAANAIDLMASSLVLINTILDSLSGSIDKRIKFYERLHGHEMLTKFAKLRAWRVSIINSLLSRWDEALRRDYNIARSQRSDAIVLDSSGSDSTIRDMTLFKSFIAHYQEAKAAEPSLSPEGSDADDEFLRMNLSTYSQQSTPAGATARSSRPASIAESATSSSAHTPDVAECAVPPFMAHSRSHSNVAETGSLRNLRAAPGCASHPGSPSSISAGLSDSALVGLKSAHSVLKRAFLDTPRLPAESSTEARRELKAIVELAQAMLSTFD